MKRHIREGGLRTPVAPAILVLAMAAMSAAVGQQKTTVVLGTATQGGGFQIYGAAYSAALNEADATLAVEQRSTKGSTENIPLLAEGKIDIGLATGEVTHEATYRTLPSESLPSSMSWMIPLSGSPGSSSPKARPEIWRYGIV